MFSDSLWASHGLEGDTPRSWSVGDLSLSALTVQDEIWLAHHHQQANVESAEPAKKDWSRWALKKPSAAVSLKPVFPDKSVVVKPEVPFHLLPGVQVRVYVRVPLWVAVASSSKDEQLLSEFPAVVLSLTWFGTPMEGELCYWISSSARRQITTDLYKSHLAICPVQLKNSSEEDLLVDKLCLRVRWLSLFDAEGQLWSNETKVSYKGSDMVSQVSVSSGAPREAPGATLRSGPREHLRRSFGIKTFFSA